MLKFVHFKLVACIMLSMRSSRAHFKYALKFAKRVENTAKADALAKDLGGQKHDNF